jgi:predicted F0F1-ATPase subunit
MDKKRERFDLTIEGGVIEKGKRRETNNRPTHVSAWAAFEFFGQIGLSISLPMVAGTMLGAYLDSMWHTKPQATLAGLVLGFFLSIGSFVIAVKQFRKRFLT